uniref:Putative secreted peptide n=1 Tax=Anopheles braziliensis TaxID=58242 RepID=A0A2M3ZT65_9DIPT
MWVLAPGTGMLMMCFRIASSVLWMLLVMRCSSSVRSRHLVMVFGVVRARSVLVKAMHSAARINEKCP